MDKHQLYLCCNSETELWDWITSFLKAQNDDSRPPVLRRHSSSDISKQKFGTMPLVPIRGDESNSTMLSANQTLRKLHARRTLSMFFPMKVQQDSFEERAETPPPEPLYEEVGDFGLQVLKSLETSFLSNAASETQEVPEQPLSLSLLPLKTASLDRMIGPNPVHILEGGFGLMPLAGGSLDTLVPGGGGSPSHNPETFPHKPSIPLQTEMQLPPVARRRQQQGVCTPSQELLLQELSSVFTRKTEPDIRPHGANHI